MLEIRTYPEGKIMPNYGTYPGETVDGTKRWIEDGILPGDFLQAVIRNDLTEACARADQYNIILLPEIVAWWYGEAPAASWGSPGRVKEWKKFGGQNGIDREGTESSR